MLRRAAKQAGARRRREVRRKSSLNNRKGNAISAILAKPQSFHRLASGRAIPEGLLEPAGRATNTVGKRECHSAGS